MLLFPCLLFTHYIIKECLLTLMSDSSIFFTPSKTTTLTFEPLNITFSREYLISLGKRRRERGDQIGKEYEPE